jgi:hypothetical protein
MLAMQFVVNDIQKDFLDVEPLDPDDKVEAYSDAFEVCGMRWCGLSWQNAATWAVHAC